MTLGADFLQWAIETFGSVAVNPQERAMRFVEEAIELGHTQDIPKETLLRLVERIYSRPAGTTGQEIGQASVTLEMLAVNLGYSEHHEARREFERVKALPKSHWVARHLAKVERGLAK